MCEIENITRRGNITQRENQLIQNLLSIPDILTIVVAIIGIFLNGLLLILCRKRLPGIYVIFVRNLATADLCTALSSLAWAFRRLISSRRMWDIIALFSWTSVFVSFLTLLAVVVQRYIAVVHSVWSHSTMKKYSKLFKQISVAMWLVSTPCGILYYFKRIITSFVLTFIFEAIIIITIVLYFKIYKFLRKYRMQNRQGIFANQRQFQLNMKKEAKLTVVVFWITGVLIVGVLPYIILLQIRTSHLLFGNRQFLRCNTDIILRFSSYWFVVEMLSFSLNPIIYAWRFRPICSRWQKSDRLLPCFRRRIQVLRKRIAPEHIGNVPVTSTGFVKANEVHVVEDMQVNNTSNL